MQSGHCSKQRGPAKKPCEDLETIGRSQFLTYEKIYIYIYIVHIYIYRYIGIDCIDIDIDIDIHTHTHAHTHKHLHTHTPTHTYTQTHPHLRPRPRRHTHTHSNLVDPSKILRGVQYVLPILVGCEQSAKAPSSSAAAERQTWP